MPLIYPFWGRRVPFWCLDEETRWIARHTIRLWSQSNTGMPNPFPAKTSRFSRSRTRMPLARTFKQLLRPSFTNCWSCSCNGRLRYPAQHSFPVCAILSSFYVKPWPLNLYLWMISSRTNMIDNYGMGHPKTTSVLDNSLHSLTVYGRPLAKRLWKVQKSVSYAPLLPAAKSWRISFYQVIEKLYWLLERPADAKTSKYWKQASGASPLSMTRLSRRTMCATTSFWRQKVSAAQRRRRLRNC